jgi:hypothetical protein
MYVYVHLAAKILATTQFFFPVRGENEAHARTRREKKKIIKKENIRPTDRKWGLVLPCSVWNRCEASVTHFIF